MQLKHINIIYTHTKIVPNLHFLCCSQCRSLRMSLMRRKRIWRASNKVQRQKSKRLQNWSRYETLSSPPTIIKISITYTALHSLQALVNLHMMYSYVSLFTKTELFVIHVLASAVVCAVACLGLRILVKTSINWSPSVETAGFY